MVSDLQYLPVNWIDGMKISRKHFEETERYVQEQLRDVSAQRLADFEFGILPSEKPLDLTVFCDFNQHINIELTGCTAITPNGTRIHVHSKDPIKVTSHFKEIAGKFGLQTSQTQNLYIVLSINPFERIPTGEPLMNESPPRNPYSHPEIKLDIIPAEHINPVHLPGSLVIGKISYQNGELLYQKDFVPSCTAINSLPSLVEWYGKFRQQLENWEQYCIRIVQKTNSKTQTQQSNTLALSIQKLSEKILEQLVMQKLYYQWMVGKSAPIYLCGLLLKNIHYIHAVLQCYPEKDREEMLNYFAEWTDVQAGMIENQTLRALQLQYNHYDLQFVLGEISQVYQTFLQIFQKLSQLDFIGKKKGQNIFVIEQQVKETKPTPPPSSEKPNTRWSPLS
jgi:hypothetical protein